MKKIVRGLMAATLTAATLTTGMLPAAEASAMPRAGVTAPSNIENVDYRDGRRHYRGRDRHSHGRGYYRGYRGSLHYRDGYRRYSDGYWYPLAAFTAGAIIGGAIAAPPPPRYSNSAVNPRHFDWCAARYRSYRAFDNTFQPYSGPRQQCLSPYY
ncbi:BA14K family protein [Mycoplana dimorpha]|uniref:Lectin-like protein BA14k n=1 Tax=Mycoplana dimorpha TaxID=28320 RepID=A0A2T5BE05_MYCDI|nr:BA14K family protein [Mycoplana dimorpha]PTM97235.1 BA14K-like protein [Mycoplana dimorpha]